MTAHLVRARSPGGAAVVAFALLTVAEALASFTPASTASSAPPWFGRGLVGSEGWASFTLDNFNATYEGAYCEGLYGVASETAQTPLSIGTSSPASGWTLRQRPATASGTGSFLLLDFLQWEVGRVDRVLYWHLLVGITPPRSEKAGAGRKWNLAIHPVNYQAFDPCRPPRPHLIPSALGPAYATVWAVKDEQLIAAAGCGLITFTGAPLDESNTPTTFTATFRLTDELTRSEWKRVHGKIAKLRCLHGNALLPQQ